MRQHATLETRPDKHQRPLAELVAGWRRRAAPEVGEEQVEWVAVLAGRNDLPLLTSADVTDAMLYASRLRQWFAWCESTGLDPLVGIPRAHVELYIRGLGDRGLMDSSVNTMTHAVRGYFRFAHIDGVTGSDPAVYARPPKIYRDESRAQRLDRLELIRVPPGRPAITVHHGALAYLLGINALRASEAAAVRIEDYADTLRGYRVLHLVGKGNKPATMPLTVPVLRQPDRPARCLPHGRPDRKGSSYPTPHQPALAEAHRDHQRPGRRGSADLASSQSQQELGPAKMLLHVAADWPAGNATLDDVARLLARLGWTTRDGHPVTAGQLADTLASLHDHLGSVNRSVRQT